MNNILSIQQLKIFVHAYQPQQIIIQYKKKVQWQMAIPNYAKIQHPANKDIPVHSPCKNGCNYHSFPCCRNSTDCLQSPDNHRCQIHDEFWGWSLGSFPEDQYCAHRTLNYWCWLLKMRALSMLKPINSFNVGYGRYRQGGSRESLQEYRVCKRKPKGKVQDSSAIFHFLCRAFHRTKSNSQPF